MLAFFGGIVICPVNLIRRFNEEVEIQTVRTIIKHRTVTWEVNDWACVEMSGRVPIQWYDAVTHDSRMMTNFMP